MTKQKQTSEVGKKGKAIQWMRYAVVDKKTIHSLVRDCYSA